MAEDPIREPVPAAGPAGASPGAPAPDQSDPATASAPETPPVETRAAEAPRATNAGRVWVSIAVATVLLILLIIFIAENSRSVRISFLGAGGHISLALALLIAAIVGAAVTLLVGSARILQLRRQVRRGRRGAATGARSLQSR